MSLGLGLSQMKTIENKNRIYILNKKTGMEFTLNLIWRIELGSLPHDTHINDIKYLYKTITFQNPFSMSPYRDSFLWFETINTSFLFVRSGKFRPKKLHFLHFFSVMKYSQVLTNFRTENIADNILFEEFVKWIGKQ